MDQTIAAALATIGDQSRTSEPPHAQRARFHQSWYRSFYLGIKDFGRAPSGRPIGSILPAYAASAGANFTSVSSKELFVSRRAQGWGVDPVRMTSHMTSSQALLVNLLGPLWRQDSWLLRVLASILGRTDFKNLVRWEIEFAPSARSRYLNDMTRVDAFFVVETTSGVEGIVLELKYVDRFSARWMDLPANRNYSNLARSSGAWVDADFAFTDSRVSQMVRCHALGIRTLQVEYDAVQTTMLLVSHPTDPVAADVVARYRSHLVDDGRAVHVGLDRFVAASVAEARSARDIDAAEAIVTRYLDQIPSEPLWLLRKSARDRSELTG